MIKPKKKICKGQGITSGYGCNEPHYLFKKELCKTCFIKWATTTPEGNDLIKKATIRSKKQVLSIEKKEIREKKKELMTVDEYRSKIIQPIFNEIARLIDYGQPCIATGNYTGKKNGGHYHAVGANRTLAINLHNIHIQSEHSNSWKGGDNIKYREGLKRVYGQEYLDYVESLSSIKPIHLSKNDLDEIKAIVTPIRNKLRNNPVERTPEERIKLREEINKLVKIY